MILLTNFGCQTFSQHRCSTHFRISLSCFNRDQNGESTFHRMWWDSLEMWGLRKSFPSSTRWFSYSFVSMRSSYINKTCHMFRFLVRIWWNVILKMWSRHNQSPSREMRVSQKDYVHSIHICLGQWCEQSTTTFFHTTSTGFEKSSKYNLCHCFTVDSFRALSS